MRLFDFRPVTLDGTDLRFDPADNRLGDLVLNRENILEFAIVVLRPQMYAFAGIDQARHYAHAIARLLHLAFEDIVGAEFTKRVGYPIILKPRTGAGGSSSSVR